MKRVLLVAAIVAEVLAVVVIRRWFGANGDLADALSLAFVGWALFMGAQA